MRLLWKKLRNRRGQGTIEYVVILAAVIGLAVLLISKLNDKSKTKIETIATQLN